MMGEVKSYFRPEFINRIDEVVVFHALDEKNIKSIARIQLQYLEKRLAADGDEAGYFRSRTGRDRQCRASIRCTAQDH